MKDQPLDVIRSANCEFRQFIDQVAHNGTKVVKSGGPLTHLDKIDARLREVSQLLAAGARAALETAEAAGEVRKYGEVLHALRTTIEILQFSLRKEKARMENVRGNLKAARAWATSLLEIS